MNISSIIIKVPSCRWEEAIHALSEIPCLQLALQDRQKETLIGIIEAESLEAEIQTLRLIEAAPHVMSANMHLCYNDEEFKALEPSEIANLITSTPIDQMRYSGDVNAQLNKKK